MSEPYNDILEQFNQFDLSLFDNKIEIDFRPITVFIGENSIGKSHVMRQIRDYQTNKNDFHYIYSSRHRAHENYLAGSPYLSNNVGEFCERTLPHLQKLIYQKRSQNYKFILPYLEKIAKLNIPDYTFSSGAIHCMPILVQGTIMNRNTTLLVENPESLLHPTSQLELGSFFADLWNKKQINSVIETHSDKILLRLRRLIAKNELSNQDAVIVFFTRDDNDLPIIKNICINKDGSLQPGLPMTFFGADVIEAIQLGAKQ